MVLSMVEFREEEKHRTSALHKNARGDRLRLQRQQGWSKEIEVGKKRRTLLKVKTMLLFCRRKEPFQNTLSRNSYRFMVVFHCFLKERTQFFPWQILSAHHSEQSSFVEGLVILLDGLCNHRFGKLINKGAGLNTHFFARLRARGALSSRDGEPKFFKKDLFVLTCCANYAATSIKAFLGFDFCSLLAPERR